MKKMGPREPTSDEKEDHEKTHIPFRNWCRHCVRGRGKEEACRRDGRIPEVPEVHLDFMFMGRREVREDAGDVGGEGEDDEGSDGMRGAEEVQWRMASKEGDGVHEGVWV
jgi:hypothetical protein